MKIVMQIPDLPPPLPSSSSSSSSSPPLSWDCGVAVLVTSLGERTNIGIKTLVTAVATGSPSAVSSLILYTDGTNSSMNNTVGHMSHSGPIISYGNSRYSSGSGGNTSGIEVELRVLLDHSVIEAFAGGTADVHASRNGGYSAAITQRAYPEGTDGEPQVQLYSAGGAQCTFVAIDAWSLRGISL
jgi:hypothetical protein